MSSTRAVASALIGMCEEEKLMVINKLQCFDQRFPGTGEGPRFSELDPCIASIKLINYIRDFTVLLDERLPSDHAPICISLQAPNINMEQLKSHALLLGNHAVLMTKVKSLSKAPVKDNSIDLCKFSELLSFCDQPIKER